MASKNLIKWPTYLADSYNAKMVYFGEGAMELCMCEKAVFFLPANILMVNLWRQTSHFSMVTCSRLPDHWMLFQAATTVSSEDFYHCKHQLSHHFLHHHILFSASATIASSIFTGSPLSGQFVQISRNLLRHSVYCPSNIWLSNIILSTDRTTHKTTILNQNFICF